MLRNYDETRTKDAEILNQIGKSFNSNEFIDKSISLYKFIVNKINDIENYKKYLEEFCGYKAKHFLIKKVNKDLK